MADVKISIVTVCFNSVATIEQTIKSVINQSYKNIEYIIIDGGSTDGTFDIIKKYESYISYWVSEPDKGIYDAMNKGIKVATGKLIAFINSDDWYDKDAIYHFAEAYKEEPADVLFGDLVYIKEDGSTQYENNETVDLKKMLYTNKLCHQAICVNTQLMKASPFDLQYKIAADYDFLLRLFMGNHSFRYVGNYLISYFRFGGVSSSRILDTHNEIFEIARKNIAMYFHESKDALKIEKVNRLIVNHKCYGIQQHIFGGILRGEMNLSKKIGFLRRFKYVVYGSGKVGRQILNLCNKFNIEVDCFIDGNNSLWGSCLLGKKIISPKQIHLDNNTKIIISSYEYSDDMANVLIDCGFKENKVFFGYDIWVKWLQHQVLF